MLSAVDFFALQCFAHFFSLVMKIMMSQNSRNWQHNHGRSFVCQCHGKNVRRIQMRNEKPVFTKGLARFLQKMYSLKDFGLMKESVCKIIFLQESRV